MRRSFISFDAADTDQDRELTFDEFSALVREREGGEHSESSLRARFAALDTDGDGKISLQECTRATHSALHPHRALSLGALLTSVHRVWHRSTPSSR